MRRVLARQGTAKPSSHGSSCGKTLEEDTEIYFADAGKSGCGCFFWVIKGVIQIKTQSKPQEKPAHGCPQPPG